jgi:hypothetical protein
VCSLDWSTLNSEIINRGLTPSNGVVVLEVGGPSNSSAPGYNSPFGLLNNIDTGD